MIHSGMFYGFIVSNLLGSLLIKFVGGKNLVSFGILFASVASILVPLTLQFGASFLILMRILMGLGLVSERVRCIQLDHGMSVQGLIVPATYTLVSAWVRPNEQATHLSIILLGMQFGNLFMLPFSAWVCSLSWRFSWMALFFFPDRGDIEGLTLDLQHRPIPWLQIMTSVPVWAAATSSFCASWTYYIMLTHLPSYLTTVLHSMTWETVISIMAGLASDYIVSLEVYTRTAVRRTFEVVGICPAYVVALHIVELLKLILKKDKAQFGL
ncbi:SLC17A5 [Cordylochernes scorpioides]|uniref:SLC17A5 n=1 Tax=Cordylochernes scorpioides TaxID=51811 RepID=A0ABY6KBU3_9ARAC|nr:SLC17A5 [Cordylochernes scorpioides]